ncbi:hypothetical protein BB560_005428, partial [Smittium megazygosporum]
KELDSTEAEIKKVFAHLPVPVYNPEKYNKKSKKNFVESEESGHFSEANSSGIDTSKIDTKENAPPLKHSYRVSNYGQTDLPVSSQEPYIVSFNPNNRILNYSKAKQDSGKTVFLNPSFNKFSRPLNFPNKKLHIPQSQPYDPNIPSQNTLESIDNLSNVKFSDTRLDPSSQFFKNNYLNNLSDASLPQSTEGSTSATPQSLLEDDMHNLSPSIPNRNTFAPLIRVYSKNKRLDDAFKFYELMKTRGIPRSERIYSTLLLGCLSTKDFKRAWETYENLRYEIAIPGVKIMTIMINVCTLDDQVEKALNILDEIIINGQTPTDVTFNSLISACARRQGFFDKAIDVLVKMERAGFRPDYYTYNSLMYAASKNKNLEMARLLFSHAMDDSNEFMRLDTSSFSCLFWSYSSAIKQISPISKEDAVLAMSAREPVLDFLDPNSKHKQLSSPENQGVIADSVSEPPNTTASSPPQPVNTIDQLGDSTSDVSSHSESYKTSSDLTLSTELFSGPSLNIADSKDSQSILGSEKQLNPLFARDCPNTHKDILFEASRVYNFFKECLRSGVVKFDSDSQLKKQNFVANVLNAYLSVLINHGNFDAAWEVYENDFDSLGTKRDGWTIQMMLNGCDLFRDLEKAWIVFGHYKIWREGVEKNFGSIVDIPKSDSKEPSNLDSTPVSAAKTTTSSAPPKPTDNQITLSEKQDIWVPKYKLRDYSDISLDMTVSDDRDITLGYLSNYFFLPETVYTGTNQVPIPLSPYEREAERRRIGCDERQELSIYRTMINLLAKNDQLVPALYLLQDLKYKIPEHPRNELKLGDFMVFLRCAEELEDSEVAEKIKNLCKPTETSLRQSLIRHTLKKKWTKTKY